MEGCEIHLNDPDQFDHAVHGDDRIQALPSNIDLTIITKHAATETGRAGAVITWTCETPEGRTVRAQFTTTVRILKAAFRALDMAYDDNGKPR